MSLLIINTLSPDEPASRQAVEALRMRAPQSRVFDTRAMNISHCIGCNACWLITPGVCAVKDDYEQIIKAYLEYDDVVFIAGASLGFVDHHMKNVVDRVLPLFTMYTYIEDGQMRHVPRYDKKWRFGLLYSGEADGDYLTLWTERFAKNMLGESMGAFPIENVKEAFPCI